MHSDSKLRIRLLKMHSLRIRLVGLVLKIRKASDGLLIVFTLLPCTLNRVWLARHHKYIRLMNHMTESRNLMRKTNLMLYGIRRDHNYNTNGFSHSIQSRTNIITCADELKGVCEQNHILYHHQKAYRCTLQYGKCTPLRDKQQ
jgi:hypothetical protein